MAGRCPTPSPLCTSDCLTSRVVWYAHISEPRDLPQHDQSCALELACTNGPEGARGLCPEFWTSGVVLQLGMLVFGQSGQLPGSRWDETLLGAFTGAFRGSWPASRHLPRTCWAYVTRPGHDCPFLSIRVVTMSSSARGLLFYFPPSTNQRWQRSFVIYCTC